MQPEIITSPQGSPEWFAARLGIPTASNFAKVLAGGTGATRKTYLMQLLAEIVTGERAEGFTSFAMEWGTQNEDSARATYELMTGRDVEPAGLFKAYGAGASPDGLVGADGLVEIKCPNTTTHLETVLAKKVPPGHIPQIQGQIWITGRQWCDFVSYDPRVTRGNPFFCVRVERDDAYINNKLAPAIELFLADLGKLVNQVELAA